jgi:hypothetical protein
LQYDSYSYVYLGVVMQVYEQALPAVVHVEVHNNMSNSPASRKGAGLAGHSHKKQLCHVCKITHPEINEEAGYDIESAFAFPTIILLNDLLSAFSIDFEYKDDWVLLSAAFKSKNKVSKKKKKKILNEFGA